MTVAAIDIGTNSTNLLLLGDGGREFRTVDARLGEGLDRSGRLAPNAIERTLATLADHRRRAEEAGATRIVAVTTAVARHAANREDFLGEAERVLGVRPVVLSGEDEGRWAFRGALGGLDDVPRPLLLLDIGGGSTELTVGSADVEGVVSVPVGSVRLTEAELRRDPPRPEELTNAIGVMYDHLDDVVRELPAVLDVASAVGIGGTIATVAAVELGGFDAERIHGLRLGRDAVEDVFRTLATEALADRVHNPGLPTSRAGVIVGGLCILVAVMRRLPLDEIVVSQRTLLDGIAADVLAGGEGPQAWTGDEPRGSRRGAA